MKKYILLGVLGVLAGCVTGYGPYGMTGGYKENLSEDGVYSLLYQGNATNNDEQILQFWHQRASELCPSGYEVLEVSQGHKTGNGALMRYPFSEGKIRCKNATLIK